MSTTTTVVDQQLLGISHVGSIQCSQGYYRSLIEGATEVRVEMIITVYSNYQFPLRVIPSALTGHIRCWHT